MGTSITLLRARASPLATTCLPAFLGGNPIQAGFDLSSRSLDVGSLHPGEVVVATLDHGDDPIHLLASILRVERAGFAVSSVQRLASGRHSS